MRLVGRAVAPALVCWRARSGRSMARQPPGELRERLGEAERLMRSPRPSDHAAGAALLAAIAAGRGGADGADGAAADDAAAQLGDAFVNGSAVVRYIATRTAVDIAGGPADGAAAAIASAAVLGAGTPPGCAAPSPAWRRVTSPQHVVGKVKRVLYSNDASARVMAFVMLGGMAEMLVAADEDAVPDGVEILHAMWQAVEGGGSDLELRAASRALRAVCGISARHSAATLPRVLGRLRVFGTDAGTAVCLAELVRCMHHTAALAWEAQRGCERVLLPPPDDDGDDGDDEPGAAPCAAVARRLLEVLTALALRAPSNVGAQSRLLQRVIRSDGRRCVPPRTGRPVGPSIDRSVGVPPPPAADGR